MNSIRSETAPGGSERGFPRWAIASACVVLSAGMLSLLTLRQPRQTGTWPEIPTRIEFNASFPANPLETEINNLQADTLNAAKALAATFLPSAADATERN